MNNREKGLVLYKLASGHPQMTKMAIGALLKSLPTVASTFLKYKPQNLLNRATNFVMGRSGNVAGGIAARNAYNAAKGVTGKAWNNLNPWVQRSIKYPAQIGLGYAAGIPIGGAGWLGFTGGNEVDKLRSKQEGATEALTGVHDQMSQMGQQLGGMGMMDRAGLAFKMLTDGNFAPGLLQGAQGQLEAKIKEINPKAYAQRFGQAAPPPTQNYNR